MMASHTAPAILGELASWIQDQSNRERVLLVGIDGVTGAGKTILAATLKRLIDAGGTTAFVISVDDFHNPRALRHSLGRHSPEGYYLYSHNYEQLNSLVIERLRGPRDRCSIVPRAFDLARDCQSLAPPVAVEAPAVVLVEGSFMLRESLRGGWDISLYVTASRPLAVSRVAARDENLFGSQNASRIMSERIISERYHGAHDLHDGLNRPARHADLCIENTDAERPVISCLGRLRHRRRRALEGTPFLAGVSHWIRGDGAREQVLACLGPSDRIALWDDRLAATRGSQPFVDAAVNATRLISASGRLPDIGFQCDCGTLCQHIVESAHGYFGQPARIIPSR